MTKTSKTSSKKPDTSASHYDPVVLSQNMTEAMFRTQQIANSFVGKQANQTMDTPFDPLNIAEAFAEFYQSLMNDPKKLTDAQASWWQNYVELCGYATKRFLGDEEAKPVVPAGTDKRFAGHDWQDQPLFDVLRQSYLMTSKSIFDLVADAEDLPPKTKQKVEFYTRQLVDAFSPSNYLLTNPKALEATIDSNGENILKGLDNLEHDLETGKISMTDYDAFEVGKNLATTPGYVVYQNELIELIQYSPSTKTVHEVPLLLIPAWINKFYIFDLQKDSSLISWLVSKGYTVFVISWVNPSKELAGKHFDDYMKLGPLMAMDVIKKRTKCENINLAGYCLGGTLLATTLAYLHAKKKAKPVVSATYFTTMVDFREAGDLSVFVDEEQIANLEHRMQEKGYLEGNEMANTFNMLRANDLIWSFVVHNYLLGKEPFPFDLLYWNSDSTRMPAMMHSEYMRNMYLENNLVKKGCFKVDSTSIDISSIKTPTFILSTRDDHIAPWRSTYEATKHYGGPVEFVLAASGHIAGVMNAPHKNKYCYWTASTPKNKSYPKNADTWLKATKETHGSWWDHWEKWLAKKSGKQVNARSFTAAEKKKFTPAPGEYVKVKS